MNSSIAKVLSTSLLCMVGMSFAHAADEGSSQAEVKKQIQVCNKKKQGEWVSYANKGVTFNGTCEPNENGKLQFTFPAPPAGAPTASTEPAATPTNTPNIEQQPTATDAQAIEADTQQQASPEAPNISPEGTDASQALPEQPVAEPTAQ